MTPIEVYQTWCVTIVLVSIIVAVATVLCTYYNTRHSMKKQMAHNAVMHVIDSLDRNAYKQTVELLDELTNAANALYDAGHWVLKVRADKLGSNEDEYWIRLRDAMSRKPGSAPPRSEGDR